MSKIPIRGGLGVTHKSLLMLLLIAVFVCTLFGCATTYEECSHHPSASVEREVCDNEVLAWRLGIDRENWELCYKLLRANHITVMHHNRTGMMTPKNLADANKLRPFMVKELLVQNRCREGLGKHWAGY